jgi:hypothetical protein
LHLSGGSSLLDPSKKASVQINLFESTEVEPNRVLYQVLHSTVFGNL